MELKVIKSCSDKECISCGHVVQAGNISFNLCGQVYCAKCMKEIRKAIDDLAPSLEFSRETFVKLP